MVAGLRELESLSEILDDARPDLSGAPKQSVRHGHAGPSQVDSSCQSLKSALPDQILQHESEGRNLDKRRARLVRPKKIDRLRRASGSRGGNQRVQAFGIHPAIRIEDHDDVWRIACHVFGSERERMALPAAV